MPLLQLPHIVEQFPVVSLWKPPRFWWSDCVPYCLTPCFPLLTSISCFTAIWVLSMTSSSWSLHTKWIYNHFSPIFSLWRDCCLSSCRALTVQSWLRAGSFLTSWPSLAMLSPNLILLPGRHSYLPWSNIASLAALSIQDPTTMGRLRCSEGRRY